MNDGGIAPTASPVFQPLTVRNMKIKKALAKRGLFLLLELNGLNLYSGQALQGLLGNIEQFDVKDQRSTWGNRS